MESIAWFRTAAYLLALFISAQAFGQNYLDLRVAPEVALPIARHSENYTLGGGGVVSVGLGLAGLPLVMPRLELGYSIVPLQAESGALLNLLTEWSGPWEEYAVSSTLEIAVEPSLMIVGENTLDLSIRRGDPDGLREVWISDAEFSVEYLGKAYADAAIPDSRIRHVDSTWK